MPDAILRSESAIDRLADALRGLLADGAVEVNWKPWKKKRSDEQNRYWWGVVIAAFCQALEGWEPDDVHTYLLGEHFGWERIEGLGKARVKPMRRSSRLNKTEFAELVAHAQRLGAQHGIYVPDPNEGTP